MRRSAVKIQWSLAAGLSGGEVATASKLPPDADDRRLSRQSAYSLDSEYLGDQVVRRIDDSGGHGRGVERWRRLVDVMVTQSAAGVEDVTGLGVGKTLSLCSVDELGKGHLAASTEPHAKGGFNSLEASSGGDR